MLISDWSSDVGSSDLWCCEIFHVRPLLKCGSCAICRPEPQRPFALQQDQRHRGRIVQNATRPESTAHPALRRRAFPDHPTGRARSEEHTSELQSIMRISYAVFSLKKKKSIS